MKLPRLLASGLTLFSLLVFSSTAGAQSGTASVSPDHIYFGTYNVDHPPVYGTVVLTNNGSSSMSISSIGSNLVDPFLVSSTTCGSTLNAGASCNITVEFDVPNAPIGVYQREGMNIVDSATNSPQYVQLGGEAACNGICQ
jgi:hypothetical protein